MLKPAPSPGRPASPYHVQPARAFWRRGVAADPGGALCGLWQPDAPITSRMAIATYGSCFAQHVSRALIRAGFNWLDCEPPPAGLSLDHAGAFGYRQFSSRTGNIHTAAMLRQWCEWALAGSEIPAEIWYEGARLIDPFRPRIEPDGFGDRAELLAARTSTLAAFRASVATADLLIFTLGLTECWRHRDGHEYPLCPGTAGGRFDAELHHFVNQDYPAILDDLNRSIALMQRVNPGLRLLLSVSPVPLAATAGPDHVVVATTYSKSVLRAAAGAVAAANAAVDYFPSYEMITSPVGQGRFFAANQRDVTDQGVQFVMQQFFRAIGHQPGIAARGADPDAADAVICDEEMQAAFGQSA
ncbi:MAG: GSCFA domain-containing protein [Rhodobacteraceae bacterium]|nr:GSCFA domain-containing protein [Paracoccaceae bacterium]